MKVPILMYHSIEENHNKLSISLKKFDAQMKFMKKIILKLSHLRT